MTLVFTIKTDSFCIFTKFNDKYAHFSHDHEILYMMIGKLLEKCCISFMMIQF